MEKVLIVKSKSELIKRIICELYETDGKTYITTNDIYKKLVEYGIHESAAAARRDEQTLVSKIVSEMKLYKVGKVGSSFKFYKEPPKQLNIPEQTDNRDLVFIQQRLEKLEKNILDVALMESKILSTMQYIVEGLAQLGQEQEEKPKATAPKKTATKRVKMPEPEIVSYMDNLISKSADDMKPDIYYYYVTDMIRRISLKTGQTVNQVKTDLYKEMKKEYGFSDSDERRRFIKAEGHAAQSGIELMYSNNEYRSVYYNKVADKLAKVYGL